MRRLEIKILQLLGDLQDNDSMPLSVIHLGILTELNWMTLPRGSETFFMDC
ncbi:MAG: hypothetical protein ACLS9T_08045 [Streptococcus salivarius]